MIGLWANFKVYIVGGVIALLVVALLAFGAHERSIGADKVYAAWNLAKLAQAGVVATSNAEANARVAAITIQYDELTTRYLGILHAPAPKVSDSVAADVDAGALRLRNQPDVCPVDPATATARSRAADAAATQALANRVQDSIAAVRAGDDADARERQLGAQVTALQGVVRADREPQKP